MSETERALDLYDITSSPSKLGQYLAPKIWGARASYRADPWLLKLEEGCMDAVSDWDHERFVKSNAPSQIGKSMFDEVFLPFWALGLWPETRVILVGYSDGIAQRSGGMVRDLVKLYGMELFGIELDPDYQAKGDWKLNGHVGGMLSVGIGSMITGRSGELVLIGDIIKNMTEAASKTEKQRHWEELDGSIMPRLQPGGTVVLAATRFADDDLSGRLDAKAKEADYDGVVWESYVFPAIAEPDDNDPDGEDPEWRDIIGRRKGEPLTCRFSKPGDELPENWHGSHFYRVRRSRDPYTFACIYMQQPVTPEGSMFDPRNWNWYDPDQIPPIIAQRRVWDLSATDGSGDWTVGLRLAKLSKENEFAVIDVQRDQKSSSAVKAHVEAIASTDGVAVPIMFERERNGAGKTVFDFYKSYLPLNQVEPAIPDGDKHTRARPAAILHQQRKLFLPKRADGTMPDWVPIFVDECKRMMWDGRSGRHDDQVDTLAHGINAMIDNYSTFMYEPDIKFSGTRGLVLIE